jgi:hypothetical protein
MEPDDINQKTFFPDTVAEAIKAIERVLEFEEEYPERKGEMRVISTHRLFLDMFRRLTMLEEAWERVSDAQLKEYLGG